ncbi:hypothetical protein [Microbulbifer thermotolerans]|uniref:Uncharacterized protein n=1 Tax=Microbulbifer thermotolerans TaxID=252514 RepID=A0AB35HVH3_MICTH|nr:hypothetical protein [Microbulbifer thermotolerans]MCX2801369.1 hypothetical protein [Microbulbifer thermotolerans]MCX2830541.1 hypothetical protein [Microbulbifer thermotolerans]
MIPDPNTKEGREEIKRRAKKRKNEAQNIRDRAVNSPDKEPSGKLTNPNDLDRIRDRKSKDE